MALTQYYKVEWRPDGLRLDEAQYHSAIAETKHNDEAENDSAWDVQLRKGLSNVGLCGLFLTGVSFCRFHPFSGDLRRHVSAVGGGYWNCI